MAITEVYGDFATIGATEYSCPADSTSLSTITTDGVYQCFFDVENIAAGDTFTFRIYEKAISAGTKRVVYQQELSGDQQGVLALPALVLMHGWDVTIQKIAGTDREISWSIRQIA